MATNVVAAPLVMPGVKTTVIWPTAVAVTDVMVGAPGGPTGVPVAGADVGDDPCAVLVVTVQL